MDLAVKRHSVELGHGAHAVRLRRSVTAALAGSVFQEIGGAGNAFGGFGHEGGDLTGSSDALRSDDGAQVRDQCFLGGFRKLAAGADFQSFDRSCPDRIFDP